MAVSLCRHAGLRLYAPAILFAGLSMHGRLQGMHLAAWAAGIGLAISMPFSSASAQYNFNPSNADESGPGIKYFGSAKDDQGALLPGVTMVIAHAFTLVTDEQGRYRGNIDEMYTVENTPVGCSKPGYEFVRVVKRAGPANGAKKTIQADCILHKIK
jgi:hypothetical protein